MLKGAIGMGKLCLSSYNPVTYVPPVTMAMVVYWISKHFYHAVWQLVCFFFGYACYHFQRSPMFGKYPNIPMEFCAPNLVTSVQWRYETVMKCLLITANKTTPFPKKKREAKTEVYI
jgi:hypothetical protein